LPQGDNVFRLYSAAEVPAMQVVHVARKTNLWHGIRRHQARTDAGRHQPLLPSAKICRPPLHGMLHVHRILRYAGDCLAKIAGGMPLSTWCATIGLRRVNNGIWPVTRKQTKVEAEPDVGGCSDWAASPQMCVQGARMVGAVDKSARRGLNRGAKPWPRIRLDPFRESEIFFFCGRGGSRSAPGGAHRREVRRIGMSLECVGQV